MKKIAGRAYSGLIRSVLKGINPIKKRIVSTPCLVHVMINNGAVSELEDMGYHEEFSWFCKHREKMNEGVIWADQDFKSINHFFHHSKKRGLFGFEDAHKLFMDYYMQACINIGKGETDKGMFYFGAALHLLQDSTVPHHVLNRLMFNHRKFETWIINNYAKKNTKIVTSKLIQYDRVSSFIFNNVEFSYKTYIDSRTMPDIDARYHFIGRKIVKRSQSTTLGLMVKFYKENIKYI